MRPHVQRRFLLLSSRRVGTGRRRRLGCSSNRGTASAAWPSPHGIEDLPPLLFGLTGDVIVAMKPGIGIRLVVSRSDATTVANLATKQSVAWGELLLVLLLSKFARSLLFVPVHRCSRSNLASQLVCSCILVSLASLRTSLHRFCVLPLRLLRPQQMCTLLWLNRPGCFNLRFTIAL
jgi:hypothetical protein